MVPYWGRLRAGRAVVSGGDRPYHAIHQGFMTLPMVTSVSARMLSSLKGTNIIAQGETLGFGDSEDREERARMERGQRSLIPARSIRAHFRHLLCIHSRGFTPGYGVAPLWGAEGRRSSTTSISGVSPLATCPQWLRHRRCRRVVLLPFGERESSFGLRAKAGLDHSDEDES